MQQLRYTALLLAFLALAPSAAALANECDLSRQAYLSGACPVDAVGAASPNPGFNGATVDQKTDARSAIDAFGYCRYVGNASTGPQFIPFGSEEEWRAYLTNHPAGVSLAQCARGGLLPMPPNFGTDGATNQCVGVPAVQSTRVPYRPANVAGSYVTPPVTYDCHSADGTEFSETAVATVTPHDSGYGPSDDIGWSYTKILYSYDGKCGAAKGVEVKNPPKLGLCSVGVPSAVIGTGPFTWICASGNGGGKNITCSTGTPCETRKVEEKPCRCEDQYCYRPVLWADSCGHSWIDKSEMCEAPEPNFKPLPPIDYDNDHLSR